jgi:hypothetical protein
MSGVAGDYNNNHVVDTADYVLWRKFNNTATTLANDSTSGTNAADYDVWRARFGQSSGSGTGAVSAVPEPEPITSVFLVAAAWYFRRGRRA